AEPVKAADPKSAPAVDPKKPAEPVNAADPKTAPTADPKKPAEPGKAADPKAASAVDPKTAPAADPKKPIEPVKAADTKSAEKPSTAQEPPKGVQITQIFDDRLDKPDDKALKSLPIPKEGEGFSMRLHPAYFYQFLDHPFSINREVADYKDLYESIKANGINEPIKARPRENGGLELISGHRRHDIAAQLNYPVPVVIVQMDDDSAKIEVVDGNLHRQDIPTSELARAAKMKMEALARKAGRRSKMDQLTAPQKRTDQQVADDMGMSRNQVNRLVRIDALVPELKHQVDEKKLPFNTAVELSYMKPEEQSKVVDFMQKEQVTPSMAQATALKEASREAAKVTPPPAPSAFKATQTPTAAPPVPAKPPAAPVDETKISAIIKPKKEPELKVTFTGDELRDYFPKDHAPTVSEVKRTVFDALDLRKRALERQAKAAERPKKPDLSR
ncbi:MAG: ParB N-terminal domain-containing protein, partial [Oscillospiraceae bacterium]|nr:ParB N-terminal domain-containing protein [Oscillospiraceae bacterium]